MRALDRLPVDDPGTPDLSSPTALLRWLAWQQRRVLGLGVLWGSVWMLAQAAVPAALGGGVNAASSHDRTQLAEWSLLVLALGATQAAAGILRHRMAVSNWIYAASRIQQLVARRAAHLGADLPRQVATGEVVAVTANDVERIGSAMDVCCRFAGAVVSFLTVAVVLLVKEPTLGAVVVVGVPVVALGVTPLIRPLERRERAQRARFGEATAIAADTVAGLRVLRGIGGEELFVERFHTASDEVRRAAVRSAKVRSLLDALQVALPGIFVVAVTWLGAHLALEGKLSVGALVAFYGYTAFLVLPLRTITETAQRWTSARVAAARTIALLLLERSLPEPSDGVELSSSAARGGELVDAASGFRARPGRMSAVVSAEPHDASALVDRLGRYLPGEVSLGRVSLTDVPTPRVREHVLVQDKDPALLAGTLRENLDVPGAGAVPLADALGAADADDIVDSLPQGLDTELPERGRSLSGGQRQRVALARSLYADPDVLLLDEPTSAVDAHTEARIAERLVALRRGRTTVVTTTSPLLLDRVDDVSLLVDGRVAASGTHRELLHGEPAYRRVVLRSEEES
ncbi:MAG TPA: ABC transporter ATP-binding protein [Actinomycetes bacterium]|nr:ABC transporter ATP-binding protein [Actinomycetes bacterium]